MVLSLIFVKLVWVAKLKKSPKFALIDGLWIGHSHGVLPKLL